MMFACFIGNGWERSIHGRAHTDRSTFGKGGFAFAMAAQIPRLMQEYQRDVLATHTPCQFESIERVVEALAIAHCELVLIHPFREGNGRITRLISTLMALQAGLPLLNFSGIRGPRRKNYFLAVQAAMGRNYEPMKKIFRAVLRISGSAA